jgi:hypothetical protein
VWSLRLQDFMHALQHNFEQLHIFQELVISTVSTGILIIRMLRKVLFFKIPIYPRTHVPPPSLLVVAHPTHCTSISGTFKKSMSMHRSHGNLVVKGCLDITCQCLPTETFLVKKPRSSSLPAHPCSEGGGPFCLSRNIHQISDCLHMFNSSTGHQGSPSACERKQPLLSRRGRDKSKAVAKYLTKCCASQ